jgi:hypothetical protein
MHDMPCHHTLEHYLTEYMEAASLGVDPKAPLFQALQHRHMDAGLRSPAANGSHG